MNAFDILALAQRLEAAHTRLSVPTEDTALWSRRLHEIQDAVEAVVEGVRTYNAEQKYRGEQE